MGRMSCIIRFVLYMAGRERYDKDEIGYWFSNGSGDSIKGQGTVIAKGFAKRTKRKVSFGGIWKMISRIRFPRGMR